MKYVAVTINGHRVNAMLDSGCTRTCIKKGEIILNNATLEPNSTKLLCANNEYMETDGNVDLNIQFSPTFSHATSALVVENLSAPLILGLDIIKDFSFKSNSPFVYVNNHKLRLIEQNDYRKIGTVAEATFLEPFSENFVTIKNRFGENLDASIFVDKLDKHKNNSNFLVTPTLHKSTELIQIIVANRTPENIKLEKFQHICTLELAKTEQSLNAVIEMPESQKESEAVKDFQKKRENMAKQNNFIPEIGSYGDASTEEEKTVRNLVQKHRLAFSMGPKDLGKLGFFRFTMPLLNESDTAHQPPRPIPIHLREKVDSEITNWKELGLIKPTQSGFNIPLLILKKPDQSIRISLDARQLNTILKPDRYPLPHMKTVFSNIGEKLTNAKNCYISQFDLFRGYWQIQCEESEGHKTSFSYKNRHYEAQRMLYGLSTAPACFARIMSKLFGDHPSIIIYLDDILIVDKTLNEHLKSLEFLFDTCRRYGLLLSGKKTQLCQSSIDFLGHTIDQNGIRPQNKHKLSIEKFPAPVDKKSLKRFLGLINFNLRYVPSASITLKPLYKICSTKHDYSWENEQESAFNQIKTDLLSAKGLCHRNPSLELILVCDASKYGAGSTLYQDNKGTLEVIAYTSKAFSPAEIRRSMREKELMSVSFAIRHLEYYLLGTTFVVISDHKSLLYLYREHLKTNLDSKLLNIFFYLQNFRFEIVHRPGTSDIMASADCISRLPRSTLNDLEKQSETTIPDKIFHFVHFPDDAEKQNTPKMKIFLRALAHGNETETTVEKPKETPILEFGEYSLNRQEMKQNQESCDFIKNALKKLELNAKRTAKQFGIFDDLLYKKKKNGNKILVISKILGKQFLQYTHIAYGHCGNYQLMKIMRKYVHIPNLKELTEEITRNCVDCLRMKPRKAIRPSLIKKRHFEDIPFQKTSMDLYDLGKADINNKRYLVTFCCHLTGFCDGVPISNKTDNLVSKAVLEIILRYGITGTMIADNGREFGDLTKQVLDRFKIRLINTTAYHSQSNGKVERIHREITAKLKLLKSNHRNWSEKWNFVRFLLNNLPKSNLDGLSAAECVFGRSMYVPFETIEPIEGHEKENYVKALNEYLQEIHPSLMAYQYNKYSQLLQKDRKGAETLKIGSKALVWKPSISGGKLSTSWTGPYTVIKRISKDSYILRCKDTKRTYRRNIKNLRPLQITDAEPEENLIEEKEDESTNQNRNEFDNTFSHLYPFDFGKCT